MGVHPLCVSLAFVSLACAAVDPPEVPVTRPAPREVTDHAVFTGRTAASRSVEVRPRVSGYLTKVAFKDGDEVKQGDLLFEIDPRPYQAELEKAQAGVAVAQARLQQADADYQRRKALSGRGGVSQEELDRAAGERVVAEAGLRAARAALDAARLTLGFAKVHAPMSGRIGRRLLDPGNLVKADETPLATLVATGPLYVYFDVDERTLAKGRLKAGLPVAVGLAGEDGYPHEGRIDFLDSRVDAAKGTVRVRAVLANPAGRLRPGQSARVRVAASEP
jgi:RND family efflux transporter MFP subunit